MSSSSSVVSNMPELKQRFRDAEMLFERTSRMKISSEFETRLLCLVKCFNEVLQVQCSTHDWQSFVSHAKCRVISTFAVLLSFKSRQALSSSPTNEASLKLTSLADVCYAALLCLANMTPEFDKRWSSSPLALFDVLEAHHMLQCVSGQRKLDLLDNIMHHEKIITELVQRYFTKLHADKNFLPSVLAAFPPQERMSAFSQFSLSADSYRLALESFILNGQDANSFVRVLWLLLFSWDDSLERLVGNDIENMFTQLPPVPKIFALTKIDGLSQLDVKVFLHLSVQSARVSDGNDQRPFLQSRCQVVTSKNQEAWWSSLVAHRLGRFNEINHEHIELGLCCLRLLKKKASIPPLILHSVARMLHNTLEQSKTNKPEIAVYAESYWQTLEHMLTGSLKPNQSTLFFMFPLSQFDNVQRYEDREALIEQCRRQIALALLERMKTKDALTMLEQCHGPLAMKMRVQIYEQLASAIDDKQQQQATPEGQSEKTYLINRAQECLEKLKSTREDDFDEAILSNQELKLINDNVRKAADATASAYWSSVDSNATFTNMNSAECDQKSKCTHCTKLEQQLIQQNSHLTTCIEKITDSFNSLSLQLGSVLKTMVERDRTPPVERTPTQQQPQYTVSNDTLAAVAAATAAAVVNSSRFSSLSNSYNFDSTAMASFSSDPRLMATPYAADRSKTTPFPVPMFPERSYDQPAAPAPPPMLPPLSASPMSKPVVEKQPSCLFQASLFPVVTSPLDTVGSAAAGVDVVQTKQPFANLWPPKKTTEPSSAVQAVTSSAFNWPPTTPLFGLTSKKVVQQDTGDQSCSKSPEEKLDEPEPPVDVVDYAPAIPLPDLIEVATGEEGELVMFKERAKLFVFDPATVEYKERGRGDLKVLKDATTGRCRLLMRRDAVHKLCANQKITADLELKPKGSNSFYWKCQDFSDGELTAHIFAVRFSTKEIADQFSDVVESCKRNAVATPTKQQMELSQTTVPLSSAEDDVKTQSVSSDEKNVQHVASVEALSKPVVSTAADSPKTVESFLSMVFSKAEDTSAGNLFTDAIKSIGIQSLPLTSKSDVVFKQTPLFSNLLKTTPSATTAPLAEEIDQVDKKPTEAGGCSDVKDGEADAECDQYYEPVVPLPNKVTVVTGEEDEDEIFCGYCRLYRYDPVLKEHKERGVGNLRMLKNPKTGTIRLVMRRDVILNVIVNHPLVAGLKLIPLKGRLTAFCWTCLNYLDGQLSTETLSARFKDVAVGQRFHDIFTEAVHKLDNPAAATVEKTEELQTKKEHCCEPLTADTTENTTDGAAAATTTDSEDNGSELLVDSASPDVPFGFWLCPICDVQNKTNKPCVYCELTESAATAMIEKDDWYEIMALPQKMKYVDVLDDIAIWTDTVFQAGAQMWVKVDEDYEKLPAGRLCIMRGDSADFDKLVYLKQGDDRTLCNQFVDSSFEQDTSNKFTCHWEQLDFAVQVARKGFKVTLDNEDDFERFRTAWKSSIAKADAHRDK